MKTIVSEAKATVVYPQDTNGDVKADVGQTAYQYTIRLAATAVASGVGFNTVNIDLPSKFKDVKVTSLKITRAGIESAVADYASQLDTKSNRLSLVFGSTQAVLGTSEFSVINIGLVAKIPSVKALYRHTLSLFNSSELASMPVDAGVVTIGGVGETGKLAVEVVKLSANGLGKYGVFGQAAGNVLTGITGSVSVWDDRNTTGTTDDAFSSNIFFLPSARNVIVQTTPVIAVTESGFDYLQVDLPYGSGIPSNIVVFYRSSSGNIVYLEQFYDYEVDASVSDLTIKLSSAVNSTTLGSTNGVFFTKLKEKIAAQNLFVSFDMTMPNRLGTHFFDVFVLNSVTKSDLYYLDDAKNVDKRPVVNGVVTRSAQEDGTRFMRVDQQGRGSVSSTVQSVAAELTTQDQFTSDLTKDARRTLRLDIAVTPGTSNTYDTLEVQMPEGFNTFSRITLDDGTGMKQYVDYNVDLEHPRSVGLKLLKKRSVAATFTLTLEAQTPAIIPADSVTYTFAVVVGDQEATTLTKHKMSRLTMAVKILVWLLTTLYL